MAGAFLRYKRRFRLSGQHEDSIISLAFNPSGSLLASGAVDGQLCLWSTSSGLLTHVITGGAGFLCLVWLSDDALLGGMEDGFLVSIGITNELLSASGFHAHHSPIENVAWNATFVATGAHAEIRIWSIRSRAREPFLLRQTLPSPSSVDAQHPVIVTSLHWAPDYARNALVASYLHHGIIIWNALTSEIIAVVNVPRQTIIGSASLSRDHCRLAISNLSTEISVYNLRSRTVERTWEHERKVATGELCLPVKFLHRDRAIVGGSTCGSIKLWAYYRDEPLQTLDLHGDPIILAVDAHDNPSTGRFLVATGTAGHNPGDYIQVWEAQASDDHDSIRAGRSKRTCCTRSIGPHRAWYIVLAFAVVMLGARLYMYIKGHVPVP